jgi:hypothetical protein
VKFLATVTLTELLEDTKWLARAADTVREHWRIKNARKSEDTSQFSTPSNTDNSGTATLRRAQQRFPFYPCLPIL